MTFDLRAALLKKGEVESARLDDFAFRLRARTMRVLAARLGEDADALAARVAAADDATILSDLALRHDPEALHAAFRGARAEARDALIADLGDPTPHRLA
ncbi:MAG: hypothetical protein PGN23_00880 [Sphingomonas adhaesiva]|uniref:hypothetical protein n=1 Tax=Sphingomonas adhaesiva TaxID=28212 RepID=UPI002FFC83C7